jgi:hypothetical protein
VLDLATVLLSVRGKLRASRITLDVRTVLGRANVVGELTVVRLLVLVFAFRLQTLTVVVATLRVGGDPPARRPGLDVGRIVHNVDVLLGIQ